MEVMHGLKAGENTVFLPVQVDDQGRIVVAIAGGGAAVATTGPLTNDELRAAAVPVSGPLTDAQLRATAIGMQGVVTASNGAALSIESLAQALAYDASGRLSTVTVTVGATSYRRTLTYDASDRVINVSGWVVV